MGLPRLGDFCVTVAYRADTGLRALLADQAIQRGWTPAVVPYPGYATTHRARILGRVLLAPAAVDPAALRGIPGWRRLLTLERPGTDLEVEVAGVTVPLTSGRAGIIDAEVTVETGLPPGPSQAFLRVPGREPVAATVHVAAGEPVRGLVCDIDDTVWITGLSHPARAAWRTLMGHSSTRRSVPGMARLLRAAVEGEAHPPVIYLSNGPWNLAGPVARFLDRHHFPPGALLMTDWGITPRRWFRDGRQHKASSLARLVEDMPTVKWVLVGDDGEHDPELYSNFAAAHPTHVAAIALRQVQAGSRSAGRHDSGQVGATPLVSGADGDELLPRLKACLAQR